MERKVRRTVKLIAVAFTAFGAVYPVPGADALFSIWAGRHICRNVEVGLSLPDAGVVDAEDGEILRLDGPDIVRVRNS